MVTWWLRCNWALVLFIFIFFNHCGNKNAGHVDPKEKAQSQDNLTNAHGSSKSPGYVEPTPQFHVWDVRTWREVFQMSETDVDLACQSFGFNVCFLCVCVCGSSFLRYTKMKTATNIYIFNLALADSLALATLPFQVIQMINKINYQSCNQSFCILCISMWICKL